MRHLNRNPEPMTLFPRNDYSIQLDNDIKSNISELKKRTLPKNQFVTNWNNQTFIGEIRENTFEIKLSKKLFGEICILKGKLEKGKGMLEIRTGTIFKIIFIATIIFALSGIVVSIIQNKLEIIFHLVMSIITMRLILELGFRFVSKSTLNKLVEIIGVKK